MPFMALMVAPLSAMLSVTEDDGSLGYLSHARVPPILYFGVHRATAQCMRGRLRPGDGSGRQILWLWPPEFADGCYLGPYSPRRRRLSSITRAPRRKVMGVPGQRWQAAWKVASAI